MANRKILCVDDDEKILRGILRQQSDDFDVSIATGPAEALELIKREGPFAVVVSDMRMPEMNGVQLLSKIREVSPDTVRIILTGYAELESTIQAVNQGHIFRFLSKPCSQADFAAALESGLRQYALVEAERELVEGTLHGSVKVLSEVLSLVNPLAFGQSTRVCRTVNGILKRTKVKNQWQVEIAAMLSSLGCVALPTELLEKYIAGTPLSKAEANTFANHPTIAGELIRTIPRLDHVADIIASQNVSHNGLQEQNSSRSIENRILQLAKDFDSLELALESPIHALAELKEQSHFYGTDIVEALSDYVISERSYSFKKMQISEIKVGMVLDQDLKNRAGRLLMTKGQAISESARRFLMNVAQNDAIEEPIRVVLSREINAKPPE